MYLKLGSTNIQYESPKIDNFMIFSQVIDSGVSFERPILVSTKEQLDIWFGRNFSERSYFEELLDNNIVLFLTKPVSTRPDRTQNDYIEISLFSENQTLYYELDEIENPEEEIIYKVFSASGSKKYAELLVPYDEYIYYMENLVRVQDLPQNINGFKSDSLNNRDTLKLYMDPIEKAVDTSNNREVIKDYIRRKDLKSLNLEYTTPEYAQKDESIIEKFSDSSLWKETIYYWVDENETLESEERSKILTNSLSKLKLDRVKRGYQTFAFDISYLDSIVLQRDSYLVIQCLDYTWGNMSDWETVHDTELDLDIQKKERELVNCEINYHIFFYSGLEELQESYSDYVTNTLGIESKYWKNGKDDDVAEELYLHKFNSMADLRSMLEQRGFYEDRDSHILYSAFPIYTTYFYKFPGFSLEPNYIATHNLLNEIGEGKERITFWSKTIGSAGEDGNIQITITEITEYFYYRVEIKRYDHVEVFEGYTVDFMPGTERLDYMISKYSSLVYCDINEDNLSHIPTGTWEMRGAVDEGTSTPQMYHQSLDALFNPVGEPVYFDFLLIPDIEKYNKSGEDAVDGFYKDYIILKDYAETLGSQVLVQNNPVGNGNEDYFHNYTLDVDNRIVYFYHDMTVQGEQRPGYYQFIRALLSDIYSISTDLALYISPLDGKNSYEDTEMVKRLEKYKSNYLIDNNQIYYYKNYQNGNNYNTTVWMRFVLGKLARELEKNKWNYLGKKMSGRLRDRIENIIRRVVNAFSIIRSVQITSFDLDYSNNRIDLTMNTSISDLIENNMTIDITINYKKY